MTKVNMHEAKSNFSKLVAQALSGEEVIIARSGEPMVRLVPVSGPAARRPVGLDRQEVSQDFLEESLRPLEADELEAFYSPEPMDG